MFQTSRSLRVQSRSLSSKGVATTDESLSGVFGNGDKYCDDAVDAVDAFRLIFNEDDGERNNAVSLIIFERTGFESKAGNSGNNSARAAKVSSGRMTCVFL